MVIINQHLALRQWQAGDDKSGGSQAFLIREVVPGITALKDGERFQRLGKER